MNATPSALCSNSGLGRLVGGVVLLALGAFLAWAALVHPNREQLRSIEGLVIGVADSSSTTKTATVLHEQILVQDGTRVFQLRHEYLPQLRGITPGQAVRVLAEPDLRGFFWIWELESNNKVLLSYEQSIAREQHSSRFNLAAAAFCVVGALALAAWQLQLRHRSAANAA